jgi:hypothetical protein
VPRRLINPALRTLGVQPGAERSCIPAAALTCVYERVVKAQQLPCDSRLRNLLYALCTRVPTKRWRVRAGSTRV